MMYSRTCRRFFLPFVWFFYLGVLLGACGPATPPAGSERTATPAGHTPTPVVTPPPTTTSCPARGTARAAVMAPLAPGNHPNIVYVVNEFQGTTSTFGTLKRFDVTSGTKTEILKMPGAISFAQLSVDGQWILFVSVAALDSSDVQKLQLVRVDGRGWQTLYCSPTFSHQQWSTDQKRIVLADMLSGQRLRLSSVYLLDVTTGTLTLELAADNSNYLNNVEVWYWLDNTRIYVTSVPNDGPPDSIYLLDTSKGPHQHFSDLITVASHIGSLLFIDSSPDGSRLFIDYSSCSLGGCLANPPGVITSLPATGGAATTIFHSTQYSTGWVRAVTAQTLLVTMSNRQQVGSLWEMQIDGSGLKRLTTDAPNEYSVLNGYSQNPWSNVSRDGSAYAVAQEREGKRPASQGNQVYTLLFGHLNGGAPTTFASIADGTRLAIVGWTTM